MSGYNEKDHDTHTGYGHPDYRKNADYGSSDSGSGKQGRTEGTNTDYNELKFEIPEGRDGKDTRSPLLPDPGWKDDPEKRRKIVLGAIIAAAAVLLLVVIISAASQIARSIGKSGEPAAETEKQIVLGGQTEEETEEPEEEETKEETEEPKAEETDEAETKADEAETDGGEMTVAEVVRKVMPSMVSITNVAEQEFRSLWGDPEIRDRVSAGSGIIVGKTDDALLIATNYHVVEGAKDITAAFADDSTAPAEIRGYDADVDLAVVSVSMSDIAEGTMDKISVVTFGDSDKLEVGESVVAIGNALGYGQSVSAGIVSALNRVLKDSDGTLRTLIQTDASINPGNSGGALINMRGELIGINEIKYVDATVEGVGYAIPTATAVPIIERLENEGEREKAAEEDAAYLGITCMTMPSGYTQGGYPSGVYITEVVAGGPADAAGARAGDIITSVGGHAVKTQEALLEELSYYSAGEELNISVSRLSEDGRSFEKEKLTITLGSRSGAVSSGLITENGLPGSNYRAAESPSQPDDSKTAESTSDGQTGSDSEDFGISDFFR